MSHLPLPPPRWGSTTAAYSFCMKVGQTAEFIPTLNSLFSFGLTAPLHSSFLPKLSPVSCVSGVFHPLDIQTHQSEHKPLMLVGSSRHLLSFRPTVFANIRFTFTNRYEDGGC